MRRNPSVLLTLVVALAALGCGSGGSESESAPVSAGDLGYDDAHSHHAHAHSHAQAGPHGGHLIELGEEEYHAEWLHDDDSGLVTVYLLDDEMKREVPIEAASIEIEVTIQDTRAYTLTAVNASRSETPRSAQFQITDKSLIEALKIAGPGVEAKLRVEIDGKSFVGSFEHEAH